MSIQQQIKELLFLAIELFYKVGIVVALFRIGTAIYKQTEYFKSDDEIDSIGK